ncbi:hypothetical protein ACQ7HM_14270 [Williamsia sp. MIQD14]|uniref:hypothetical protein n=1 Tax=Williamsia sp. MIQD14 TaxID=3425703 RepID=UPI003DA191E9
MTTRSHRNEIALAGAALGTFAAFSTVSRPYAAIGGVIAVFAMFAKAPSGDHERNRISSVVKILASLGAVVSVAASISYWTSYSSDAALAGGPTVTARAIGPLSPDASGYAASLTLELTSHTEEGSYIINVSVMDGHNNSNSVSLLAIDFRQGRPITRTVLVLNDFVTIAATSNPEVAFDGLIKLKS